ncbi:MAG: hypothetical protein M1818_005459 [Claussenomyces sp. TS43310]|nr:MAG: hypothetical protein M1818_005459 [Claussenomyces sp. TS43310]
MSSFSSRKNALKWVGASKSHIIAHDPGKNGAMVVAAIENIEASAEKKYGAQASYIQIQ